MWFHFKISTTTNSYCIVLAIVTFATNFVNSLQVVINNNTAQSIEKFIDDLYERNNNTQIIKKPKLQQNEDNKFQIQSVPPSVVLMMKLISYYEDKFKIANHEPTERGTTVPVQTEKLNISNKITQRFGFKYKNRYDNNILIPDVLIA